jgi:hypothetical protein
MKESSSKISDVIGLLDSLRTNLAGLKELTENIELGSIISDEEYFKLIGYNEELAKYFALTSNGYKFTGDESVLSGLSENILSDADSIRESM